MTARSLLLLACASSIAIALFACGKIDDETASPSAPSSPSSSLSATPPDEDGCCPRDPELAGCMHLGGWADGGTCGRACDFFCSEDWRVVVDDHGCERWSYRVRSPRADEGAMCRPLPPVEDAGDGGG